VIGLTLDWSLFGHGTGNFATGTGLLTTGMAPFGVQVTHVKDVASPHDGTTGCQPQMNDRRSGNEE
jgi:hypothetical protein